MDDLSPDSKPFDKALEQSPYPIHPHMHAALVDVNDSVDMAKRILLQNRVRDFSAADVVALALGIVQREQVLYKRDEE